jgi:hypothetical protein
MLVKFNQASRSEACLMYTQRQPSSTGEKIN